MDPPIIIDAGCATSDQKAWADLKGLREAEKELTAEIPTTMVMSEIAATTRDDARDFHLARGDYEIRPTRCTRRSGDSAAVGEGRSGRTG